MKFLVHAYKIKPAIDVAKAYGGDVNRLPRVFFTIDLDGYIHVKSTNGVIMFDDVICSTTPKNSGMYCFLNEDQFTEVDFEIEFTKNILPEHEFVMTDMVKKAKLQDSNEVYQYNIELLNVCKDALIDALWPTIANNPPYLKHGKIGLMYLKKDTYPYCMIAPLDPEKMNDLR